MSGSNGSSFGRWWLGTVCLGCAVAVAGVAWHRGYMTPFSWLTGPQVSDPLETKAARPSNKPEWELPQELVEAQSEPELEDEPATNHVSDQIAEPVDDLLPARRPTLPVVDADDVEEAQGGIQTAEFEEEQEAAPARAKLPPTLSLKSAAAAPIDMDADGSRSRPLMELKQIEALERDGDLITALQELSRWYWQRPEEREPIQPRLNRLARAIYFSPQPHVYEPYVIQPSDQLRLIGQKHKLSWEYLSKLNGVDARKIRAGQKLKVVPGPFAAFVSLGRYELVIHLNGSYVKSYRVGLGKDGSTPLGAFHVKNKMLDPTYYGPEGVIAHDDPQNPLGERWLDIGDGYGIHGTIEPSSIGKNESRGCIRMLNPDAEEVYDFLVIGSEVKIRR